MAKVILDNVVKRFGKIEVVHGVDLEIPDIELYSVDVTINSVNTDENKVYNNFASANLSDSNGQKILAITLGVSNIVPIEQNFSRTIPVTIYCYNNPATNVYIKLLEDANLSIEPITPFLNMNPGDKLDYLIKIEYPELEENTSYAGRTILLLPRGSSRPFPQCPPRRQILCRSR